MDELLAVDVDVGGAAPTYDDDVVNLTVIPAPRRGDAHVVFVVASHAEYEGAVNDFESEVAIDGVCLEGHATLAGAAGFHK